MLNDTCRKMQEQLPLLFNKTLSEQAAADVRQHLKDCAVCRVAFERESSLFRLALETGPHSPLGEHPEPDVLDSYARTPDRLSPSLRGEVATHCAHCEVCRDLVERVGMLPESIDELATPGELPLISQVDTDLHSVLVTGRRREITWLRFWRPVAAIAAAAAVALVAISLFQQGSERPATRVEARFPAMVRGSGPELVFQSAGPSILLDAVVYIGPEEGHTYSIRVLSAQEDMSVYNQDAMTDFDEDGYFRFVTPMQVGAYQLLIFDIVADDTLVLRRPFEILMQ